MRSSKSILAGVAAGALAVGFLSVAGATSAGAAGQKSPKAAASTVTAVRAGAVGQIPTAKMTLPAAMALPTTLQVAGAPSNTATVYLETSGGEYPATLDDSATLLRNGTVGSLADDSVVGIAVDTAGTYTVRLGNGSDTTAATFTTTGSPASISWSPASQTVLVGSPATMTLSLKDAAGNLTQAALGDTIAVSASADDTPSPTSVTAAAIYTGGATVTVPVVQAGTQTITATPLGTLPPTVVAATTSLTGSGSVSALAAANVLVTSPTATNSNPVASTASPTRAVQVPAGTASVGVQVDDTTANPAGTQLRLGFTLNATAVSAGASINGTTVTGTDDTVYVNVTTNASKTATTTVALGGAALNTGAVLTMGQYTVTNTVVSGVGLQVSQLSPAVYGSGVTFSPAGPLVGTLGTPVPVTVSVDDSFGRPQSGWTVQAWRDAATDVLLSTGTTNSSGDAGVTVVNAAGLTSTSTETYFFTAIPPVGPSVNSATNLSVAWTTSGGITSLSVAVAGGASTPIEDPVGTAPTTGPLLTAPFDGVANTGSTATYNLSTGAAGGTANGGETVTLTPTASPANSVTASVPVGSTGIFVSATSSTAWNAGQTTVTVASGASVYVFGTKVGEHTITLTSGGKSVNVKVKVQTSANAAYNINVTPKEQTISKGGFGSATVTLTDVFGNAVPGADDTNAVTVTASGEVRLGGLAVTQNLTVGADGTGTISLIAGTDGTGSIAVTPKSGALAPAWQTPYTPPTGAPAPKTSDAAVVTVGSVVTKSIAITGSRTTVSGKPGIEVDGITVGFEDGKTVVPYFRFPGETSYTEGSARPVITDDAFMWQRKTGKKFYAYVTSDDGAVQSNRVIIPAN